jgi:hypothetical protein
MHSTFTAKRKHIIVSDQYESVVEYGMDSASYGLVMKYFTVDDKNLNNRGEKALSK